MSKLRKEIPSLIVKYGPVGFFGFYLLLGIVNLPNGDLITLFRIGPAFYVGRPISLVAFSLFYFILRYRFGPLKSLSMLMFTYGTWELTAQSYYLAAYHSNYEVVMIFFVIFGLWWTKPKIDLVNVAFSLWYLLAAIFFGELNLPGTNLFYAGVLLTSVFMFVLVAFEPKEAKKT